ncbi:hypothetical protein [Anoxybacillus ayderensis]|uniref:hypothetical protein n=1 Tax=Anoxybacillus ayderensis TaxID=265546 RepID=UPI002E1AF794|nr:hypothetical protein [Anoxybacillus ayderensis]
MTKQKEATMETTASLVHRNEFYIVTLKHRNLNYYLTDPKMTISLDKGSAMLFVDEELAIDYASKVENAYKTIMGGKTLGYVECYKCLFAIQ